MPEEILETPQPAQPTASTPTGWLKIILAAIVGFGLLAASAYAGYWYGSESAKVKTQSAKPQPKTQTQPTSTPASTPEPISQPTELDKTAGWETYTNERFKFSFKYPVSAGFPDSSTVKEQDNEQAGQFQVFVRTSGLDIVLDIQYLKPGYSKNYLGSKFQESLMINTINWDVLTNQGYCDAGVCSHPFLVYQTIKDNYRYAFIFNNTTERTSLQHVILSTFKFLD